MSRHGAPIDTGRAVGVCFVVRFGGADTPAYRSWSVGAGFLSFMLNAPRGSSWRAVAYGPERLALVRDRRPGRPLMTLDLGGEHYRPGLRTRIDRAGAPEQWRWIFPSLPLFDEIEVLPEIPLARDERDHSRLRVCGGGLDAWTNALVEAGEWRSRIDDTGEGFRLLRSAEDVESGVERARAWTLAQKRIEAAHD